MSEEMKRLRMCFTGFSSSTDHVLVEHGRGFRDCIADAIDAVAARVQMLEENARAAAPAPVAPAPASPVPSDLVERLAQIASDTPCTGRCTDGECLPSGLLADDCDRANIRAVLAHLQSIGWGDVAQVTRERDELREWRRTHSVDSTLRTRAEAAEAALAATTQRANDATRQAQELRNELAAERKAREETRKCLDVERRTGRYPSGTVRVFGTREELFAAIRATDENNIAAIKASEAERDALRAELDALKAKRVRTFRTRKVTQEDVNKFYEAPGYTLAELHILGFRRVVKP